MKTDLLHLRAPGHWINDPNGFIYYKGVYHLFYQYFPYGTMWGTMHWGHAVSSDLVHWKHQGVALFPSKGYDRNGCFSGSALEVEGKLHLYYTGVKYEVLDDDNIHRIVDEQFESSQALLVSEDGWSFDNFQHKHLVVPPITDPELGDRAHTRDPKVWKGQDGYCMVLGTRAAGQGKLLFYKSTDLLQWQYVNSYSKPEFGYMWECPDLFTLTDSEGRENSILLMSPEGVPQGQFYTSHAICSLVSFQEEGAQLAIPDAYQLVDYGLDLYAPQTNLDAEGRRVLMAWMRMPRKVRRTGEEAWIGMMCLPRVIEVVENHIYFRPHPQVLDSFSNKLEQLDQLDFTKPHYLQATLRDGDEICIGGYRIWLQGGVLHVDRSEVFGELEGYDTQFKTPELGTSCRLDIFVDSDIIETFVDQGRYVVSNIVYDLHGSLSSTVELSVSVQ